MLDKSTLRAKDNRMKKQTKKSVLVFIFIILCLNPAAAADNELRIISWGGGFSLVLDMLYMFPEAAGSVVAMGSGNQAGGNFQQLLDPDFEDKAVLEMQVNAETAASFNPTHIILKNYMRKAAGSLEILDIPLLFINMESPQQYDEDLDRLGELFGNPSRAAELKSYFSRERLEVEQITAGLGENEKPGVLFLYYSMSGGSASLMVPPAGWIQTRMVEWAGGRPVWLEAVTGRGWQTVSFEQIAEWNPETVFLVTYHSEPETAKNKLLSDPLWQMLDAGAAGRIFAFPADYLSWDQPDPRWILGLNWLGTKLHPELFPRERMAEKLYDFFSTAYGFSEARIDELIIPKITGDYR